MQKITKATLHNTNNKVEKMKIMNRLIAAVMTLVILFSLSACLVTQGPSPEPEVSEKDAILIAVEETLEDDKYNCQYVYTYLLKWGITGFNTLKFLTYENTFIDKYNYGSGLPDRLVHASATARYFVENYYDNIDKNDAEALTNALLNSYVYTVGDKYAFYRTAEEFEEYDEEMSGKFCGIGIQVEYDHTKQTILVNQVFADGPAAKAGMKVGDYIVGVDGKEFDELGGYRNVIYHIRGDEGTKVTVTVDRNGTKIDITITRAIIVETSVSYKLTEEGYGYIMISSFKDNTAEQFRKAVDALEDEGAIGYIFDVRSNPGGYVRSVTEILSYILPSRKKIISYKTKGEASSRYYYSLDDDYPEDDAIDVDHVITLPMVVLCNEYTASAGEIFVSALRDYDGPVEDIIDVTIVGKTTFGKGIMQSSYGYPLDKSYVTFTIAYYNPPSEVNYHEIGITPDIFVEYDDSGDNQLDEAIKQLGILLNR